MAADQSLYKWLIAGVADNKGHFLSDRPAISGREIIERDNILAGINQLKDHVTADVAGSAGNEDRHVFFLLLTVAALHRSTVPLGQLRNLLIVTPVAAYKRV